MKNRVERKVTREFYQSRIMDDESMFRELASKMVHDMPIDELMKLMVFKKIDPLSKELIEFISDYTQPEYERHRQNKRQKD